ncbi:MAG: hypothetical protein IK083_09200 [Abditibacteriota bacterium]|nr:hypothetical protein [Abditibacteriota bacterium]
MGTGYKGNSRYYRSVGQNILAASSKYEYNDGWFGKRGKSGNERIRNIETDDNLAAAKDFYDTIAYGGIEEIIDSNMSITKMADGTIITFRAVSHSDGTPAVDINIKPSTHTGG